MNSIVYGYINVMESETGPPGFIVPVVFDICFTEFGAALSAVLPVLFQCCYIYCYSDSQNLWAVMGAGGLAL